MKYGRKIINCIRTQKLTIFKCIILMKVVYKYSVVRNAE